jgi:hypothetical protein
MRLPGHSFALHFTRSIADAYRQHIRSRQHGVDFNFASIDPARPPTPRPIEVEPVVLAVNGDVVIHWSD